MYDSNEIPTVSAILYYYDDCIDDRESLATKFISMIQQSIFYNFTKIVIRKNIIVNGMCKSKTLRYSSKDIREIDLECSLNEWIWDKDTTSISLVNVSRNNPDSYFSIDWFVGYALPSGEKNRIFETLNISCTYDKIANQSTHDGFVQLFCNMASLLNAFYGNIDDVAVSVDTMDKTKEKCFTDKYLQTVYWGNFFGKKICEDIGMQVLTSLPVERKLTIGDGFYFSVTTNIQDSEHSNMRLRKQIYKLLKPSKSNTLTNYNRYSK